MLARRPPIQIKIHGNHIRTVTNVMFLLEIVAMKLDNWLAPIFRAGLKRTLFSTTACSRLGYDEF